MGDQWRKGGHRSEDRESEWADDLNVKFTEFADGWDGGCEKDTVVWTNLYKEFDLRKQEAMVTVQEHDIVQWTGLRVEEELRLVLTVVSFRKDESLSF